MKKHLTGVQFANQHYAVPLLQTFFRNYPEAMNSKKDHRQPEDTRDWDVLQKMIEETFPKKGNCTASLEDHRVIFFNAVSGRIFNTFEKPNKDTGEWEDVNRSHNIQASDAWNHLIITAKGYYSFVRNKSSQKHLGNQVNGLPSYNSAKDFEKTGELFNPSRLEKSSLYHLAQNWDGEPFLFVDLKDPISDWSLLRLTYDWRCVQINTRDHISLDLSTLLTKRSPA